MKENKIRFCFKYDADGVIKTLHYQQKFVERNYFFETTGIS